MGHPTTLVQQVVKVLAFNALVCRYLWVVDTVDLSLGSVASKRT
jgi:hypothetical protein